MIWLRNLHPEDAEAVFHQGFERGEFNTILGRHGFGDVHFLKAHTVDKEEKRYPIFLAIATKI